MLNETRVNLKHLLEDIRDSYTAPLEEVILTELIANALDSKAANINLTVDEQIKVLRCVDDGHGMKRAALRDYHNIAASAKQRGLGIGFAGVGAKLSLLLAAKVVTESKGGYGSQCATEWRLTNPYRAPWKFTPFSGQVPTARGTAASIYFHDNQSHLLQPDFVRQTVIKHFYPLLNQKIYGELLRYFYKKPINFFINGELIQLPEDGQQAFQHWFQVSIGKTRHPAGLGFLAKTEIRGSWLENFLGKKIIATSLPAGLYISTFGKIIKGGWEWLGIIPSHADNLSGIVEIPALSEILTTNKNDFLTDSASLKKYYKFRKAVQEAVLPILQSLGENRAAAPLAPDKIIKPLNRVIDGALNNLLPDFPELESLIGAKRAPALGQPSPPEAKGRSRTGYGQRPGEPDIIKTPTKKTWPPGTAAATSQQAVRAPASGLKITLADITDAPDMILGRIIDDGLTVNSRHPAWLKAKQQGWEEYHILIAVAAVLSQFLANQKNPQEFLNRFLQAWAKTEESAKAGRLF